MGKYASETLIKRRLTSVIQTIFQQKQPFVSGLLNFVSNTRPKTMTRGGRPKEAVSDDSIKQKSSK